MTVIHKTVIHKAVIHKAKRPVKRTNPHRNPCHAISAKPIDIAHRDFRRYQGGVHSS